MTRKHFIAIAKILKENKAKPSLVIAFTDYLATTNEWFDSSRFIEATKKK